MPLNTSSTSGNMQDVALQQAQMQPEVPFMYWWSCTVELAVYIHEVYGESRQVIDCIFMIIFWGDYGFSISKMLVMTFRDFITSFYYKNK